MKKPAYDYNSKPQGVAPVNTSRFNLNLEDVIALIDRKLRTQKQVKVYEIGCGGGRNLSFLKHHYAKKVDLYGSDISKVAVSYAHSQNIGHIKQAMSVDRPFRQRFDLIIILDLLEHLSSKEEVAQTLKLVSQQLKPDGYLYLSVPLEENPFSHPWIFSHLGLPNLTLKYYGHTLRFTAPDMFNLVSKHLKLKNIDYHSHFFTQLSVLLTFFIPKIILTTLGGSELETKFRDSNIQIGKATSSNKSPTQALLSITNRLYSYFKIPINALCYLESRLLHRIQFGALAVNITASLPSPVSKRHARAKK